MSDHTDVAGMGERFSRDGGPLAIEAEGPPGDDTNDHSAGEKAA